MEIIIHKQRYCTTSSELVYYANQVGLEPLIRVTFGFLLISQ